MALMTPSTWTSYRLSDGDGVQRWEHPHGAGGCASAIQQMENLARVRDVGESSHERHEPLAWLGNSGGGAQLSCGKAKRTCSFTSKIGNLGKTHRRVAEKGISHAEQLATIHALILLICGLLDPVLGAVRKTPRRRVFVVDGEASAHLKSWGLGARHEG